MPQQQMANGPFLRTWRLLFAAFAGAVLILPAIAMRFTNEVTWGLEDFAAAIALLTLAWLAVELITRLTSGMAMKAIATSAVAALLLLTWAHLAVGVF